MYNTGGQVRTAAEAGPRHRRDLPEETTKHFQDNHAHNVHGLPADLGPAATLQGAWQLQLSTRHLKSLDTATGSWRGECVPVGKHGARLFSQGLLNASHSPAVATPKRWCWGPGSPTAGGSQPHWGPSRCLTLLSSWTHALPSCCAERPQAPPLAHPPSCDGSRVHPHTQF